MGITIARITALELAQYRREAVSDRVTEIAAGSHTISVKKTGFKDWERKLTVSSGSSVHLNPELEKLPDQ